MDVIKTTFLLTMFGSKAKWHQGVASLATYLRHNGHDANMLEPNRFDLKEIERAVKESGSDVVAATANSHQFDNVCEIMGHLKKTMPHIKTVLGGVHVSIDPSSILGLEKFGIDAVCRGEGEDPLLQLVNAWDRGDVPSGIPNMTFPGQDKYIQGTCNYFVEDLDRLPIADRDLFARFRNADSSTLLPFRVRFLFCRGCPYDCTYCCNKTLKDNFPHKGSYVRWLGVDHAIAELEQVADEYNFNEFVIDDDVFTLKKQWTMDFCNKYPERFKGTKNFEVNVRVGTVDEEMMRALKECGCSLMKIGLEAGSEEIRRTVLNRKMSNEKILDTAAMAERVGLKFHTFNIVGIPGESRQDVWSTVRLNQKLKPERVQVTVFYPYDYTALGESCKASGMVVNKADSYFTETTIKHDKLFKWEIEFYAIIFKLLVYAGYSVPKTIQEGRAVFWQLPGIRQVTLFMRQVRYYASRLTIANIRAKLSAA
ncbi:MAG TPA: radical SAM protein, partial [Nitrospinota bacterium]|nr:radical SAM protein [Nitrospinota bacterium]